jgi:hypothetical protein
MVQQILSCQLVVASKASYSMMSIVVEVFSLNGVLQHLTAKFCEVYYGPRIATRVVCDDLVDEHPLYSLESRFVVRRIRDGRVELSTPSARVKALGDYRDMQ